MLRSFARRCIQAKPSVCRFEPCCPEQDSRSFSNGFVPCKQHPIPNVLGGKIDFENDMQRPSIARHCVVCVGDGPEWSRAKVEAVQGGMVHALSLLEKKQSLLERTIPSKDINSQMLSTVCDRPSETHWPTSDVLIFPEFKRHVAVKPENLRHTALGTFLSGQLKESNMETKTDDEVVDISADAIVLVCTHERRDMRCGKLGPLIVDEFRKMLKEKRIEKVEVWGTSHFGGKVIRIFFLSSHQKYAAGHKFAGNVIIHQRGMGGHMYGNVRQCHVESIIDRHIVHQKVIKELWRGQVA